MPDFVAIVCKNEAEFLFFFFRNVCTHLSAVETNEMESLASVEMVDVSPVLCVRRRRARIKTKPFHLCFQTSSHPPMSSLSGFFSMLFLSSPQAFRGLSFFFSATTVAVAVVFPY